MNLFPVVHIGEGAEGIETAIDEGNHAFDLGANGIYLIDHHKKSRDVGPMFEVFNVIKSDAIGRYVGLNILGLPPKAAMARIASAFANGEIFTEPDDVWIDDIRRDTVVGDAMRFKNETPDLRFTSIHGGVAFKYTPTETEDPAVAASEAVALMDAVDVVTTSGAETGTAPGVAKLRAMKEAIGDKPLAVASGITLDNIGDYEGIIRDALVSSSIETTPGSGVFDHDALRDLIKKAQGLAR